MLCSPCLWVACLSAEITRVKNTTWDQFATNERLFNYKTTWDENLYTTQLDQTKFTDSARRDADRIAREIERGDAGDNVHMLMERNRLPDQDYDEEELYGAPAHPMHTYNSCMPVI